MGRGKRYNDEPKLNLKKVFAVIIAIIVIIMFILIIRNILKKAEEENLLAKNYFAVYADNKWGVIDQQGEYVISPSYENMIVVPNKNKDVFLCMYDINDTDGTYKTKAINSKNEEIFQDYDQVEQISNIDKAGNLYYLSNVLKVQKNGKYGLINLDGKNILNTEYTKIEAKEGENNILITKDNKLGIADENGNIILNPNYEEIVMAGTELFVIKEAGVSKVIDKSGTVILQEGFEEVKQILENEPKGIIYTVGDKYGVMNTNQEITIMPNYDYLEQLKGNTFKAKLGDKYGIIDAQEITTLDFNYSNIAYSKKADMYIVDINETESKVLDNQFLEKVTGIVNVYEEEGYFKVRIGNEYKYYNFDFEEKTNIDVLSGNTLFVSKQNNKYGFIDKSGNVVVDYIYDEAMEQNEYGYAAIKLNGLWGSIDKEGKVVIQPKYNLDDYIKIDFIGKWHLGKYIEMNYYCEQ